VNTLYKVEIVVAQWSEH